MMHVFANEQEARVFATVHGLRARRGPIEVEIAAAVLSLPDTRDLTTLLADKKHLPQVIAESVMDTNKVIYGLCDDVMLGVMESLYKVERHGTPPRTTRVAPLDSIPTVVPMCDIAIAAKILGKRSVASILQSLLPLMPPENMARYLLQTEYCQFKKEAEEKYRHLLDSQQHYKNLASKYEYQATMSKAAPVSQLYRAIIEKRTQN